MSTSRSSARAPGGQNKIRLTGGGPADQPSARRCILQILSLIHISIDRPAAKAYERFPGAVVLGDSLVLKTAQQELVRGIDQIAGKTLRVGAGSPRENAVVLGTLTELHSLAPALHPPQELRADGYWLKSANIHGHECLVITASTDRGVLYGVFALLSKIARGERVTFIDEVQQPYAPIRWVNEWDNLDGGIERGYGGPSIFFAHGEVRGDLARAGQYALSLIHI